MTDESDPFNGLDLQEAIDLRWTLRDIRAKRWKLSPLCKIADNSDPVRGIFASNSDPF
jgi:hypothetical protein